VLKFRLSPGFCCFFAVAIIVGYPVVAAMSELFGINNRLTSVPYRAIVFLSALLIIGARVQKQFRLTFFWAIWWLFWILYLSRLLLDGIFVPETLLIPISEYWMQAVGVCLLPAVAVAIKFNALRERSVVSAIVAVGVLGLVLTGLVFIKKEGIPLSEFFSGRLETPTLNPIALGHLAVTVMLMSLCGMRAHSLWAKLIYSGCFVIGAAGLVASGSRGPILSLIAVAFVWAISKRKNFVMAATATIIVVPAFLLFLAGSDSYIIHRVSTGFFEDAGRADIYRQAFNVFLDNIFLGGGVEPMANYPHNLLVESFIALGIFGGFIFTWMLIQGWLSAIKVMAAGRNDWVAILFVQYAAFVMVSSSLYIANVFWMMLACVVQLARSYDGGEASHGMAVKNKEFF
jgi:hypothetical protein